MAIVDKYANTAKAFQAVAHIKRMGDGLRTLSGFIGFNDLENRLDSMRTSYVTGVQPLLDLGNAAQVNAAVASFFAGSVPANTYTSMQALGTALIALYQAYDVVFDTLTPIVHDPVTGHEYAAISAAQLSSLGDELDAVIAAAAVLV